MKCNKSNTEEHKWEQHSQAGWTAEGPKLTYLICKNCNRLIIASEWAQLREIKNQTTTVRVLIVTTIISFMSLFISILTLFLSIH